MRIFQIYLIIFVFVGAASAQSIFIPFEGERKIANIEELKMEITDISRLGKPCGDYFFYQVVGDSPETTQKVVSFLVPVSKEESSKGTNSFISIVLKGLIIEFNDELKYPTAEWKKNDRDYRQIILRISKTDFEASKCLSTKSD